VFCGSAVQKMRQTKNTYPHIVLQRHYYKATQEIPHPTLVNLRVKEEYVAKILMKQFLYCVPVY